MNQYQEKLERGAKQVIQAIVEDTINATEVLDRLEDLVGNLDQAVAHAGINANGLVLAAVVCAKASAAQSLSLRIAAIRLWGLLEEYSRHPQKDKILMPLGEHGIACGCFTEVEEERPFLAPSNPNIVY
jgi:hypothetical protein